MNDGDSVNRKLRPNFAANGAHFRVSHRLVGLVFQVKRLPALEIVADKPVEDHDRSIFRSFEAFDQFARPDGLANQQKYILRHGRLLAATHWWQKRHFVPRRKRRPPLRVFLIQLSGHGRPKFSQLGKGRPYFFEKIFDASTSESSASSCESPTISFSWPKKRTRTRICLILPRRQTQTRSSFRLELPWNYLDADASCATSSSRAEARLNAAASAAASC